MLERLIERVAESLKRRHRGWRLPTVCGALALGYVLVLAVLTAIPFRDTHRLEGELTGQHIDIFVPQRLRVDLFARDAAITPLCADSVSSKDAPHTRGAYRIEAPPNFDCGSSSAVIVIVERERSLLDLLAAR